jgi:hypothetical protein
MLSTIAEARHLKSSDLEAAHFCHLRDRDAILRMRDTLIRLSARCGQTGAMDFLEYFLTSTESLKKAPYLVLLASRSDVNIFDLEAEDLLAAVLVYEYKVMGFYSRVFSTSDLNGNRVVIAPAPARAAVSARVCRYLMERGAQVVMLTFAGDDIGEAGSEWFVGTSRGYKKRWWATQTREVGATIVLEKTLDETLAKMGKHTRRNLRYYRRKAEVELLCTFNSDAKSSLTMARLIELNQASAHPVAEVALRRRYDTMKSLDGLFCVSVNTPDGQWISLLGGRRHHGVAEIDWQMNRGGLEKYSVGTMIRSFLIEHEIAIGTKRLFFEGGTPHSMRLAFISEKATDILVTKRSLFVSALRRFAQWKSPHRNFLLQLLVNPKLLWHLR